MNSLAHETRQPVIRVTLLPRDTNPHGTIFGGIILSYIDQAGAVGAYLDGARRVVTVAMEKVVFLEPVQVGDLVSFYCEILKKGRTSIAVKVIVEVDPLKPGEDPRRVTEAEITYVNVDLNGKPTPLQSSLASNTT